MGDEAKSQSWWQTLPGILTSITATITALAGLLAVIHQLGSSAKPAAPQPTAEVSSQTSLAASPIAPAPIASSTAGGANAAAERQIPTGRFANRCGCWGFIKIGSTHPDLRCQSGLAVARKCVETCPNGDHAWHYQCE
jgi:hypothetical protein